MQTTKPRRLSWTKQSLTCLGVLGLLLLGCGPSQAERDAQGTRIAANIFATITAAAPRPTDTPKATFTPPTTPTLSPTITPTRVPSNTPQPTSSPTITPRPVPTETRPPTATKTPSSGNIHVVIRYECNDQPVFSYAYAVIFRSGAQFALRRVEADKNGEVLFKDLAPGLYEAYSSSTPGSVFTYGTGKLVTVEIGKTAEISMYLLDCPLLRLVSPADGEVITTTKPEFRWENYRPGSWYQVIIDGKVGTADGARLGQTQKTSDSYVGNLEYGETYKWYVCVLKDSGRGNSVCSITSTFKVSKP